MQFDNEPGGPSVVHYLWYPGWTEGQYRFQPNQQPAQSFTVKLRPYALSDIAEVDKAKAG